MWAFDNARETPQEPEEVTCHVSSLSCRGVAKDRNGLERRSRWLILPRVPHFNFFLSSEAVSVLWKHLFSHVRALVYDAVCMQSAPSHVADTLSAFTLCALDR